MLPRTHLLALSSALALALCAAPAWAQLDYTVSVEAPSALTGLLNDHLELISARTDPDLDEFQLQAIIKETPAAAQALLETEGYFSPQIRVEEQGAHHYVLKVDTGEPVLIEDVTLQLNGDIRQQENYQQRLAAVLEAWALPMGAPYRQEDWTSSKRAILRLLTTDRFPLAKITHSQADIDPQTHRAQLLVQVDSGPLIRFGAVHVIGNQRYPLSVATGLADFRQGDPYTLKQLLDYQSALEQSAQYSGVVVNADMARIEDGQVPVDVSLTEFPKQKLELGLTYDSEDGPGTRIGYDYYNLFGKGWTGSVLLDWKNSDRNLSFGLGFPRQADGYSHSITSSFKETDIQGVKTTTVDAGAWRIRSHDKINARFGVEFIQEKETIGNTPSNNTRAVLGVFGWTRRDVDDPLRPRSGNLLDVSLSSTLGSLLSTTSFVRGYARGVSYWSPWPRYGTLLTRLELGQVWAKDSDEVPSTQLFRAGGSNSVRGYDYQSLGLPGADGAVVGGRVVATATLEYQIPVARDWAVALFHDAGNAAQSWQSFKLEHSNGLGLRWMSPVAPLSMDIAKAQRDGKIRWNMSLGLAF
ncbi:MAG: outer membrane protein assembly factor [Aquitalea sp.]|nr:outer membrane protein assembly factor [Aquitalea sp.]